jgi:hypothetical protein
MKNLLNEITQLRKEVIVLEVQKQMVKGVFDIKYYEGLIKEKKNKIAELSNQIE